MESLFGAPGQTRTDTHEARASKTRVATNYTTDANSILKHTNTATTPYDAL